MANIEFFLETSYFWLKEKQNRCYFINDKEFKYVVELDGEIEKNYILGYINSIKRYGFEMSESGWGNLMCLLFGRSSSRPPQSKPFHSCSPNCLNIQICQNLSCEKKKIFHALTLVYLT